VLRATSQSNVTEFVVDVTVTITEVAFRSVMKGCIKSKAWLAPATIVTDIVGKNTVVVPSVAFPCTLKAVVAALTLVVFTRSQPRVMVPGPDRGVNVIEMGVAATVTVPIDCAVALVPPPASVVAGGPAKFGEPRVGKVDARVLTNAIVDPP
jgi:hypothetical protein